MSRTILLDADVICHSIAYRNTRTIVWDEFDSPMVITDREKARLDVRNFIYSLCERLCSKHLILVLSDSTSNFRKELEPTYKAGRHSKPRPELWHTIRAYLESGELDEESIWYPRLEGDDTMGILYTSGKYRNPIIVSIDKDMNTLPALIYNPDKDTLRGLKPVTPWDAMVWHLTQTLTGDTTDEYKGCPGVGPVKAAEALSGATSGPDAWDRVVSCYTAKGLTEADAILQARLAYILRHGDYNIETHKVKLWNPERLAGMTRPQ